MFAVDSVISTPAHLDWVLMVIGVLTPFVTALFTKWAAPDWIKSLVTLIVTAGITVLKKGVDAGDLTWYAFGIGWLQILAAHLGSWLLTSDFVAKLNSLTGHFGLDAPRPAEPIKETPPPPDV